MEALQGFLERPVAESDTLLIVFGGRAHRFGITFSLLHRILRTTGVSIIYVRDLPNNLYLGGIVGLGENFAEAAEGFRAIALRYGVRRILTVGHCFGCSGALRFGLSLGAQGVLGLSPTIPRDTERLKPAYRERLAKLEKRLPPSQRDVRKLYNDAAARPDVTLIYGDRCTNDVADTQFMSEVPGVVPVPIHGLSDKGAVRDLLGRRLLEPALREFVATGTISPELRAKISA